MPGFFYSASCFQGSPTLGHVSGLRPTVVECRSVAWRHPLFIHHPCQDAWGVSAFRQPCMMLSVCEVCLDTCSSPFGHIHPLGRTPCHLVTGACQLSGPPAGWHGRFEALVLDSLPGPLSLWTAGEPGRWAAQPPGEAPTGLHRLHTGFSLASDPFFFFFFGQTERSLGLKRTRPSLEH